MESFNSEPKEALDRIRAYLRRNILLLTEELRLLRSSAESQEVLAIIGRFDEVIDQVRTTAESVIDNAQAVSLTVSALESVNLATQLIGTVSRMHRAANGSSAPTLALGINVEV